MVVVVVPVRLVRARPREVPELARDGLVERGLRVLAVVHPVRRLRRACAICRAIAAPAYR